MTKRASIPRLRPVIRVFVSSTFSDMKHERNALEAEAFPKLEQLWQRQGFQFQAIDLRFRRRKRHAMAEHVRLRPDRQRVVTTADTGACRPRTLTHE